MKIKLTIEVVVDRSYDPKQVFYLNQDFVRGGPLVVTATGYEQYGIQSARVLDFCELLESKAKQG